MIKLNRLPVPELLQPEEVKRRRDLYLANTERRVWGDKEIIDTLLLSSYDKCAYCEVKLSRARNVEVDHFRPTRWFPELVIDWGNLLPSCRDCNGAKGSHNVDLEPIINPFEQMPSEHLGLKGVHLYGRTALGRTTLEVLPLNNYYEDRGAIIGFVASQVEMILVKLQGLDPGRIHHMTRNKIHRDMYALLHAGTPSKSYSATAATALLTDSEWPALVQVLRDHELWEVEYDDLLTQIESAALY